MEYTKKFLYQSNQWYNDGLKKATIRDLSGAVVSLKKSLQYNRDNIPARNLLGLVYYGRGEVAEALVEWIISKNIKTHGNIAPITLRRCRSPLVNWILLIRPLRNTTSVFPIVSRVARIWLPFSLRKWLQPIPLF